MFYFLLVACGSVTADCISTTSYSWVKKIKYPSILKLYRPRNVEICGLYVDNSRGTTRIFYTQLHNFIHVACLPSLKISLWSCIIRAEWHDWVTLGLTHILKSSFHLKISYTLQTLDCWRSIIGTSKLNSCCRCWICTAMPNNIGSNRHKPWPNNIFLFNYGYLSSPLSSQPLAWNDKFAWIGFSDVLAWLLIWVINSWLLCFCQTACLWNGAESSIWAIHT